MAAPQILYNNNSGKTIQYTETGTGTSNSQVFYPSNAGNGIPTSVWKSTYLTSPALVLDYWYAGSTNHAATDFIIENHNINTISGSNLTILLQSADNSGFTSGLSTLYDIGAGATSGSIRGTFTSNSKRYWRIIFSSSGDLSEPAKIGNIIIDTPITFPRNGYGFGNKIDNSEYITNETVNLAGEYKCSQNYGERRKFEVDFKFITNTFKTQFQTFLQYTKNGHLPFYYIDSNNIRLVTIDSDYTPITTMKYNLNEINSLVLKSVEAKESWNLETTQPTTYGIVCSPSQRTIQTIFV